MKDSEDLIAQIDDLTIKLSETGLEKKQLDDKLYEKEKELEALNTKCKRIFDKVSKQGQPSKDDGARSSLRSEAQASMIDFTKELEQIQLKHEARLEEKLTQISVLKSELQASKNQIQSLMF